MTRTCAIIAGNMAHDDVINFQLSELGSQLVEY